MKKLFLPLIMLCALAASAQTDSIPGRAVIVTGASAHPDHIGNIAEMYNNINAAFEDPDAPRFLFLDKKGTVALGIGGFVKAVGMADFHGSVNDDGFCTYEIPVPNIGAQRYRFGATANHSTIFLKLVTKPTKLGRVTVYLQTNFTGDGGGYGLKLKQAYVKVGHLTVGKARSTFADGPAQAPTVDDQGPSGQVSAKNMLVQYASPSYKGFSYAISAELPAAGYTLAPQTAAIAQRLPDIPAYIQYGWGKGDNHIRLSGIMRNLSYRNTAKDDNRLVTGWGVQISAVSDIIGGLQLFGHYTYGKGISSYINDLADLDVDLIPDGAGKLKAAPAAGWTAGLTYNFTDNFFMSASYSQARLYGTEGFSADTYKYGQYIAANAFYSVIPELRIGLEYLHGVRTDLSNTSGKANRIELAVQYSF